MHLSTIEKTLGILGFIPGVSTLSGLIGFFMYRNRFRERLERLQTGAVKPAPWVGPRLARICEQRLARAEGRLQWVSAVQLVPLFNIFAAIYSWVELGNISRFRGVRDSLQRGEAFRYLCQKYGVRPFTSPSAGKQNELLESTLMELHEAELQNLHLQRQLRAGVELLYPVERTVRREAASAAAAMIQRLEPKEARETAVDAIMQRAFAGALDGQLQAIDRAAKWLTRPPPTDASKDEKLEWLESVQMRRLKLEHLLDNVIPLLERCAGATREASEEHVRRAHEALQLVGEREAELRRLAA